MKLLSTIFVGIIVQTKNPLLFFSWLTTMIRRINDLLLAIQGVLLNIYGGGREEGVRVEKLLLWLGTKKFLSIGTHQEVGS